MLVLATPLSSSQQGVRRITSYNLGLSYPSSILDFVDVQTVPYDLGNSSFAGNPTVDSRQGLVLITGNDPTSQFRGGALFVARFKVKLGNYDYSINIAPPPTQWTLIVRDLVQGPTNPVPFPRLVRWAMRVDTSGGTMQGRVVTPQGAAISGATVTLLGRERLSIGNTSSAGQYGFSSEEFGTYTIVASHPDYQPGSAKIRFYEESGNPCTINDIVLQPLQGYSTTTYTLEARPREVTVPTGNQAPIQIVLTGPAGSDFLSRTLIFSFIDQAGNVIPATPGTLNLARPVVTFTQNLPPGSFLPQVSIAGLGTIKAGQWLLIRGTAPQYARLDTKTNQYVDVPANQVDSSVRFQVARYGFYSGITDPMKTVDSKTTDPRKLNYFLRDMAGFDIDRPPLGNMGGAPGPQDTALWRFLPDQVLPVYDPTDNTLHRYPKNTGDPYYVFRAFLNANERVSGAARTVVPAPGSLSGIQGVIFHAGSMPLIMR